MAQESKFEETCCCGATVSLTTWHMPYVVEQARAFRKQHARCSKLWADAAHACARPPLVTSPRPALPEATRAEAVVTKPWAWPKEPVQQCLIEVDGKTCGEPAVNLLYVGDNRRWEGDAACAKHTPLHYRTVGGA